MHLVPPDPRLTGRWSRSLLTTRDGLRDDTSHVTWLQAGELYVDLRLPVASAQATTQGFAGRLTADGPYAVWQRLVDLHPPDGTVDEGRLDATDGTCATVVETGRDGSYTEHWHRDTTPARPVAAVLLRDCDDGRTAVLVRVGDDVAWARGHATDDPAPDDPAPDDPAPDDAEVSLGRAGGAITHSSLPWRVGAPLGLHPAADLVRTPDTTPDGRPVVRTWQVVASEGDPAHLPLLERL